MQISKSDYMLYLRNPAWLWLKKHNKTKLPPFDGAALATFDAGFLFETYAEQLFPDGVKIGFGEFREYLFLPTRTRIALEDGSTTIIQGHFEHRAFTVVCDVLQVVHGKTVDLVEIKSSTQAKPVHQLDLAFQMVVLERCGFTVRNITVIHVNNQFVRSGEVTAADICTTTDVTAAVKALRAQTELDMARALQVANLSTMPNASPRFVGQGAMKDWLTIYRGLDAVPLGSIYDLCSVSAKQLGEFEDLGITEIVDIPADYRLAERQQRQVSATRRGKALLMADNISEFLDRLQFPLYFLDYETMSSVVPYFDGMKPYQQVPFQYSLHILDEPGAEIRHFGYLHRDNSHPGRPLSAALKAHIGDVGSVIVWNKSFEMGCNTMLGEMFPEFAAFFAAVNARVIDLMEPFSAGWYIDKNFGGSASIKKVLPVLVPKLSYKTLGIQEGTAAQRLWMEAVLDGTRDDEREQILTDLDEYCGLDTLAMVEIYKRLVSLVTKV